jgi:hypothetical protein
MNKLSTFIVALALVASLGAFSAIGASAQVSSTTTSTTTVTTTDPTVTPVVTTPVVPVYTAPGFPTTGSGGETALNLLVLFASGALVAAGLTYLFRRVSLR